MLVAEDLGYSGEALEMKVCCSRAPIPSHPINLPRIMELMTKQVPNYHAPGELSGLASLRL
jgi:hypothetical protein